MFQRFGSIQLLRYFNEGEIVTMSENKLDLALARLKKETSYSAYAAAANILDRIDLQQAEQPILKVAILRNFTIEPIIPIIKAEIALMGFHPVVFLGDYDAVARDVLDSNSELYKFDPDFVILAQWLDALAPALTEKFVTLNFDDAKQQTQQVLDTVGEFIVNLRQRISCPILVNNFPLPINSTLGILDAQSQNNQTNMFLDLNRSLLQHLHQNKDVYVVDYMKTMAFIGSMQGVDERYWHIGRAPIGRQALVCFGQEYGKFFRALTGRARKCLVLDCDNVLWGGIVGEDGLSGIKLGGDYPGSCYQAFQQEVLNLHDRGVILALCSKNNESDVLEVLQAHPQMVLRQNNFSTWQINWDDKATNVERIAEELNIGLDSLVFVDDNQFECDLVRNRLPQVEVLHLSSEPATFKSRLSKKAYFDTLIFSEEDKQRTKMYRDQSKRKKLQVAASSLEEYFSKLSMVAKIGLANDSSIPRIAQLAQKTNQFNLTTRRYTEGDIKSFIESHDADVFSLALSDRVSDLGLVGGVIVKYDNRMAKIDTFLLSCRAIGRGAEDALMAHVIAHLRSAGCEQVCADYFITKKNTQVANFYQHCGFDLVNQNALGSSWQLKLSDHIFNGPQWIKIESIKQGIKP